jgi:hypothetical protein
MANTPPNNTPPNSKKLALDAAKERREQVLSELETLDVQRRQAATNKERSKIQREINRLIKEEDGLRQRIALYGEREEKLQKSIADSLADQISSLKIKKNLSDKLSDAEEYQLTVTKRLQTLLREGKITTERVEEITKRLNRNVRERLSIEEKTKKVLDASTESANAFLNDVSKGIGKLPIIGEALSAGFDKFIKSDAGKRVRDKLAEKMFDPKAIGKSLKGAIGLGLMTTGIALTGVGLKLMVKQSEVMKEIRRTLGLTNNEASEFRDMSIRMLSDSNSMATTQKEILEAASQLSNTYGTTVKNNEKLVNSQITLTKGFGLQGDEAEKINMLADATGQAYEKQLQATVATAQATGKVYKFNFNTNKILADIAKLSASIQASFKGSASSMAKAVVQTKLMGTTLTQLDSVADNLLQIESSIEAQVTAQLVTGRNINLDKARMLALNNDLVGTGQELVNQGIDYATFGKMNRVEMQATAAAMGMQKDELADMLLKQEVYKRAGADIRATDSASLKLNEEKIKMLAEQGNEEARKYINSQKQLSVQDRMTAAMERFSAVMEAAYAIVIGIGVALAVASAIMTFGASIPFLAGLSSTAIAAVAASTGTVVGGGAQLAAQSVADGIAPASNGPFTITDRKGNIGVTTAGDGLIATPNTPNKPNNASNTNTTNSQPMVNVSLVVGNTAIKEIGNKIAINNNYNAGVGNSYNRLG